MDPQRQHNYVGKLEHRRQSSERGVIGVRLVLAVVVALMMGFAALPSGAQSLSDQLKSLREEKKELDERQSVQKGAIEQASSEAERLTAALSLLNQDVNEKTNDVEQAERRLAAAEAQFTESEQAVDELNETITQLEDRLANRAISSFVGQNNTVHLPLFDGQDPTVSVRMQAFVDAVSGDDLDLADQLKAVEEDLQIEKAIASNARADAERIKVELDAALAELEEKKVQHEALAEEAELELERSLAEAAALEQLEEEVSSKIAATNRKLAEQAARARRSNTSRRASNVGQSFPSASDIVKVGVFWVHRDIADNVQAMLDHAESEGHRFSGGGYRDPADQIRLRRAHCGSSNYAIYHMPSSQCRPPTARPGRSNHEQGKALDLRHNGVFISSRSNPGFQWLSANAARYGLYNLPSEPWHWSVDGR